MNDLTDKHIFQLIGAGALATEISTIEQLDTNDKMGIAMTSLEYYGFNAIAVLDVLVIFDRTIHKLKPIGVMVCEEIIELMESLEKVKFLK